ncbi:FAD-binding oxidoreductase [Dechloromonas sp. A34]|uniref:FAD-binding oxidoreductase n=1 Tax=Dechloromonas sp. A34 TaxID=447588 RepID=UPI0022495106|nr:FAD-binding oxidoreductase [Dechloromonas sp. A34]
MVMVLSALALLALAGIAGLTVDGLRAIGRRRRAENAKKPHPLRVAKRHEVAGELLCLELADPRGKPLPAFRAGQHLLLTAPAGKNGQPIRRAYSLAAWAAKPGCYELGIKREDRGAMTQWLWQHAQPGSSIEASPAQGDFVVRAGSGTLVLIGGGIGITPMRAMLHEALGSGRTIVLFHAARTAESLLFQEEFTALAAQHGQFAYRPILSRPAGEWTGDRGRLDAGRIVAAVPLPDSADFYLCAGNAMMDSLRHGLLALGIADSRLHSEAFGAATGSGRSGLNLAIRQAGTTRTLVTAGEPTVLAALEANDLAPAAECRAGNCGQCVAHLEDGEVDWLVKPEFSVGPQQFLPCVCAARSDLNIALP